MSLTDNLQNIPVLGLSLYLIYKYWSIVAGVVIAWIVYTLTKRTAILFTQGIDKQQFFLLLLFDFHRTVDYLQSMVRSPTDKPFHRWFLKAMRYFRASSKVDHTILNAYTSGCTTGTSAEGLDLNVYKPHDKASNGVILYLHGGGWTLFSAKCFHATISYIAEYCKITVVSVDYRKSPEDPFPAGLIDCYNALLWVQRNSEELGVDNTKVFVMGDSAGGNLSAAVSLLHRDMKGQSLDNTGDPLPPLAGQVLVYPTLQGYNFQQGSMTTNSDYGLSRSSMIHYISLYLTGDTSLINKIGNPSKLPALPSLTTPSLLNTGEETDVFNPYIFPLMPGNLSNLPPAYILIARFDVLRDDGEKYAQRLKDSGNKVTLCEEMAGIHGFMMHFNRQALARGNLMKISDFINSVMEGEEFELEI